MTSISEVKGSPLDVKYTRNGFIKLVAGASAVSLGLASQDVRAKEKSTDNSKDEVEQAVKEAVEEATVYLEDNYGGKRVQVVDTKILSTVISQDKYWEPGVQDVRVIQTTDEFDKLLKSMTGEDEKLDDELIRELKNPLKKKGDDKRGLGQIIAVQVWNPQTSPEKEHLILGNVVIKDPENEGVLHVNLLGIKEANFKELSSAEIQGRPVALQDRALFFIGTENTGSVNTAVVHINPDLP